MMQNHQVSLLSDFESCVTACIRLLGEGMAIRGQHMVHAGLHAWVRDLRIGGVPIFLGCGANLGQFATFFV